MNTTTDNQGFAQPALIGGVALGVLSALPLIGPLGNACCCLWVVGGGMLAANLLQQNRAAPITPADGLLVGLLAGLIGAAAHAAISIPLNLLLGPAERAMAQRFIEMAPPEVRDTFERYAGRADRPFSIGFFIVAQIVGLMFWACVGAIFASIGGVLGSAIFKKRLPPGTIDIVPNP